MKTQLSKINFNFFTHSFITPFILSLLGILLIFYFVVVPYVVINIENVMASPVVPGYFKSASGFNEFSFTEFTKTMGKIKNKPVQHSASVVNSTPKVFYISIPKLKIKDAKVETDSTNLSPDHILGHYKGTSYPGELGNSLVYGHSVLSVFYNPKNYKTIFSTLPNLVEGDTFTVVYSDKELEYRVVKKLTLKPEDVDVYDPNPALLPKSSSTVTFLTCVPPGSKTYRLLVIGDLIRRK